MGILKKKNVLQSVDTRTPEEKRDDNIHSIMRNLSRTKQKELRRMKKRAERKYWFIRVTDPIK